MARGAHDALKQALLPRAAEPVYEPAESRIMSCAVPVPSTRFTLPNTHLTPRRAKSLVQFLCFVSRPDQKRRYCYFKDITLLSRGFRLSLLSSAHRLHDVGNLRTHRCARAPPNNCFVSGLLFCHGVRALPVSPRAPLVTLCAPDYRSA